MADEAPPGSSDGVTEQAGVGATVKDDRPPTRTHLHLGSQVEVGGPISRTQPPGRQDLQGSQLLGNHKAEGPDEQPPERAAGSNAAASNTLWANPSNLWLKHERTRPMAD